MVVTNVVEAEADDRSKIFSVLDCGLDKKKNGNMLIRLIITFFINILRHNILENYIISYSYLEIFLLMIKIIKS